MGGHKIKNIKKSIYYEYLYLTNDELNFHLVSVDSDNFNCLIPSSYQIDYAQSNNDYNEKGHICFYNDKYNYSLDFMKKDYEAFKKHMSHKEKNITKSFVNYKNQLFNELKNNNNEYIYMYYDNYYFKIHTNHKMSVNEYYDMYFILISIGHEKISKNLNKLKELIYFYDNGIYSICNDVDLINSDLSEYSNNVEVSEKDILVVNDKSYLEYKSTQTKVDVISKSLLSSLVKSDAEYVSDSFKFANLGFYSAVVNDYNEIIGSEELSQAEKNNLIDKMLFQKQNEAYSNKDKIDSQFYNYLILYLKNNLKYSLWDIYHIREFINIDKFDGTVGDEELYQSFMNNIEKEGILNMKLVLDTIKSHELEIFPNKYILRLSILNGLLNNLKIIFDDDYNLLDLNK